jgi:hypothetical protein
MIDLAQNREIALKDSRGKVYRFLLARITSVQWMDYFYSIVSTSEIKGREITRSFDSSMARMKLVESALISASGYRPPSGVTELTQVVDWQRKLPASHRMTIGNVLLHCVPIDSQDEDAMEIGVESVRLQATWGANEAGDMMQHSDLVHHFRTPTAEQAHRYMRDVSRSKVVGGSRSGKTIDLNAQPTLVALYDELIDSVEGYEVNGQPLIGADMIAREMDAYHKVVAAEQLFAPVIVDEAEEEKKAKA